MALFKKLFNRDKSRNTAGQQVKDRSKGASQDGHQVILHEKDSERRLALINEITDDTQLEALIREADRDTRKQAEGVWLKRLAPEGRVPSGADDATLTRIASLTHDDALATSAIAAIGDEPARLKLAKEHPVARVRLIAAETVTSADALHALQKHAQGKDKAVYRHCKETLAAYNTEQQARQKVQDRIDYIRSNADTLLRLGYGPEFTGKVQVLKQRWDDLKGQTDGFEASDIPDLLDQLDAILTAQKEEEQKAAALEAELQQATEAQLRILSHLQEALASISEESTADSLKETLLSEEGAWAEATSKHSASASQQKQYDNTVADLTAAASALQYVAEHDEIKGELTPEQAREHLPHVAWPHTAACPDWLTALRKAAGERPKTTQSTPARQDDSEARKKADALLNELENALEAKVVSDAANALKQIHRLGDKLSQKSQNQMQGRLRLLTNQLNELRDWQGFAVTPKKESLCEQMEALIDADIAPDLLAERIKDLQTEWKSLGHSNDRDLWKRFQEASDKAFEPCKAYFAEQAEQRAKLVTLREQLTEELRHYEANMDWESADWKTVQNTLNAARETFRSYSPVDRASHQKTQKQFTRVCDAIYAHLKAEYDRNLEQKRALVDKAAQAAASDDPGNAADIVKRVQQDWKGIGVTPRGPDQKLWNELRKHADTVFSRLGEARDARKAAIDETVAAGEAIIEEAKTNLDSQGLTAVAEAREKLADIELPKGAHGRLSKILQDMEQRLKDERSAAKAAEERGRWDMLLSLISSGEKPETDITLPAGISVDWFTQENSDSDAKKLCITMEILADIESPVEDKPARMELQVQRLAEGMGRNLSKEEERNTLIKQWLTVEADASLRERFVSALKAVI